MQELVKDYLWVDYNKQIDNNKLYQTCLDIEQCLMQKFPPPNTPAYGCMSSFYHEEYNVFNFASPELYDLYTYISTSVKKYLVTNEKYYIRSWVNIFQTEKFIGWHDHWPSMFNVFHGFYCVNTEGVNPSFTEYQIPNHHELKITSKDGLLVFGKSDGDKHRSSPWMNSERARVTIAFDVIPEYNVYIANKKEEKFKNTFSLVPLI